jgi:hypothetical protein
LVHSARPQRLGSRCRSGRSPDWLKFKNPEAPAVKREAEEDWGVKVKELQTGEKIIIAFKTVQQ